MHPMHLQTHEENTLMEIKKAFITDRYAEINIYRMIQTPP